MRSSWSLGLLMVAMGGLGVSGIGGARPVGAAPWIIAGVLVVGGALCFIRQSWVFWVPIAAAAVLVASGAIAWTGHPAVALPVPPLLSIVVGLYIVLRAVMARPAMKPKPERRRVD